MITKEKNSLQSICQFPTSPSLSMLLEASAQSSALFDNDSKKIGFLVIAKDFSLIKEPKSRIYKIEIDKIITINNINEFYSKIYEKDKLIAKGSFTIKLTNKDS